MKINKSIIARMAVLALLFGLMLGCASAPPTAFEIAGSLEGTAWSENIIRRILVINDKTSGVFTDSDDMETAFTYTAVYDAKKRTFSGTINLNDGRMAEFSAKKAGIFGWSLTMKKFVTIEREYTEQSSVGIRLGNKRSEQLRDVSFQYRTPEGLEDVYGRKREIAEIAGKYGIEYLGLYGFDNVLTRNSDKLMITYDSGFQKTTGRSKSGININIGGAIPAVWKLHSKDGVSMTMLSLDSWSGRYVSTEGVGTFNIRINGKNVIISNGTGAGAEFNGTYTADREIDSQVTAKHVQKQQAYAQRQATRALTQTQQPSMQTQVTTAPAQTQQPSAQAPVIAAPTQTQVTTPAQTQQMGAQAHDNIILKNGSIIEAVIIEISTSEIRYRPSNNIDGPIRVIPRADVLSVRFKNGIVEVINAAPIAIQDNDQAVGQESVSVKKTQTTAAPTFNSSDEWNNKWIYLGGMIGGGLNIYEYTRTYQEYNPAYNPTYNPSQGYVSPYRTRYETETRTDSLFSLGLISEFALLPFLSIELDLGFVTNRKFGSSLLAYHGFYPVVPMMAKLGYRFDKTEIFFDAGYTIGLGLSLGGTFGVNIGPGVLFIKVLSVPPILKNPSFSNGNIITEFVGYKIGLVDK